MPTMHAPRGLPRRRNASPPVPRAVVLGDLALDVALAPDVSLARGTDVPGRVALRLGGSAATTARWLARLGVPTTLICSVGRDGPGRALVAALRDEMVTVRAARPAGARTARIGMVVDPAGGERSFVADRGAADLLAPDDLAPAWFRGTALLHLPAYSLLGRPLGDAAGAAIALARGAGARLSIDLASAGPLLAIGQKAAQALITAAAPDILFANQEEAAAFLGERDPARLLRFAPVVVVKQGVAGAIALARANDRRPALRLEVATGPLHPPDTTGAGDAFDAGFLAAWLTVAAGDAAAPEALRRAVAAGNRAAARQLTGARPELVF